MLAASWVGYWVQVAHAQTFAAFIPLQLSCEYRLIQAATHEKGYPRPMNHSTSLYSYCAAFLVQFCCTLHTTHSEWLITAEIICVCIFQQLEFGKDKKDKDLAMCDAIVSVISTAVVYTEFCISC